jgi:hypothetical protein
LHNALKTENGYELRHNDIASTAMQLSRGGLKRGIKQELVTFDVGSSFRSRALFRAQLEHQEQMSEGLKDLIPLSAWGVSNHVVHMDYGPWIRQFVAEEDKQETLHNQKRTGRATRNSGGEYVRTIVVTAERRKGLAATGLVMEEGYC